MNISLKVLSPSGYLTNAIVTKYTATNVKTMIDKITAINVTGGNVSLNVYLVRNGSTAGTSNKLIDSRTIGAGESYICDELMGHYLEAGDFIAASASALTSIVFMASGREIT